ncbi:TetR/AcrR family transcriptional regulator [Zavarzinia sp.]|uniref:TetR/AcrR family transcriptional regulator n=1 Tax=Zavarzinia sp. TaxID=2027920 RepID=UPI0035612D62
MTGGVQPPLGDVATRREAVVVAALSIVGESGLEALSARSLAKHCGVSTMAIYSLFGGMPGLYEALAARATDLMNTYILDANSGLPPLDRLRGFGLAYRRFALEHPAAFELLTRRGHSLVVAMRDRPSYAAYLAAIEQGKAEGLFRPELDAREFGDILWAAAHGMLTFELSGTYPAGEDHEARLMRGFDLLLAAGMPVEQRK